ncbi:MAG: LLM class F420-dependent oxidoreductase [Rhodospirillaceae bacterium]|nr:MAG: LLM class F420-dependent oxidoreductase [Rhodospirillaceae bacterium]
MNLDVPLPFDRIEDAAQFQSFDAVAQVGRAIERAGFSGCRVTDHPCPTGRWLDAGGHHAQDPFVMLTLMASVTRKVRLQTGILVLPYRNPFITARAVATLDVFSGGRVTLGFGAGYLKGEYRALGVDFDRRNELMDEYLRALKASLSGEEFTFEGTGYEARGNRILPGPLQKPHPPFLIGGNSPRAIRRAVELGDAWNPFFTSGPLTATSRTTTIAGEEDLAKGIAYMKDHCEKVGRAQPPQVVAGSITSPGKAWTVQEIVDTIGRYTELGVTGTGVHIEGTTCNEWCDNAERFGTDVIAKL